MEAIPQFVSAYRKATPQRLKLIDLFLTYIVLTGVIQFVYCAIVGTFPFNSFLSGFISCVGSFILTGTATATRLHRELRLHPRSEPSRADRQR